jgi:hypothetical protein
MSTVVDWLEDPYFDSPEPESRDGGDTDRGALWHAVSPRWGHSMHTMCSYQGMFPARLPHYFLQAYTAPGDVVLDPFSGRGTSVLQARVEHRRAIGNDLNPLGFVLTKAKARPPHWTRFMNYLNALEDSYRPGREDTDRVSEDIRMLFHVETLDQLLYLQRRLIRRPWSKWSDNDFFLAGCVAGVLHGGHRADGSSGYLSISMPNTFSMSPSYVRKFIREKRLKPPRASVFEAVRGKAARLFMDTAGPSNGKAYFQDAMSLLNNRDLIRSGSVDLLLTSPPYLKVVNYGTANWIRLWWLGIEGVGRQQGEGRLILDRRLDHQHTYDSYKRFMLRVFRGTKRVLRRDGVAVFVIGDVAQPDRPKLHLATSLWNDVGSQSGLALVDVIEDRLQVQNKVSRIWGETRGQATDTDRILILKRIDGVEREPADVAWAEPYKDGGPDAAHDIVSRSASR